VPTAQPKGCAIKRSVISIRPRAAVIVHPEQKQVIPIDFEPIICQDGADKNDYERVAAKRLCESLNQRYPGILKILVEDALYSNAPHIRQIRENGWNFIINCLWYEEEDKRGKITRWTWITSLRLGAADSRKSDESRAGAVEDRK
jgi:hypothetical protein